jgi:hypothetical protein
VENILEQEILKVQEDIYQKQLEKDKLSEEENREIFQKEKELLEEKLKKELGDLYYCLVENNEGEIKISGTSSSTTAKFSFKYLKATIQIMGRGTEFNSNEFRITSPLASPLTANLRHDLLNHLHHMKSAFREYEVQALVYKKVFAIDKEMAQSLLEEELDRHGFQFEMQ